MRWDQFNGVILMLFFAVILFSGLASCAACLDNFGRCPL